MAESKGRALDVRPTLAKTAAAQKLKAGGRCAFEVSMKAWLYPEGLAKKSAFGYEMVFDRRKAAELTENNAHEVMRAAERDYPKYSWASVKIQDGRNLYVVEGTKKQ